MAVMKVLAVIADSIVLRWISASHQTMSPKEMGQCKRVTGKPENRVRTDNADDQNRELKMLGSAINELNVPEIIRRRTSSYGELRIQSLYLSQPFVWGLKKDGGCRM